MLNKEKSTGRARLKLLFALPIATGMLCASTMAFTKDYAVIDLYPEKYESNQSVKQETPKKKTAELTEVTIKTDEKTKKAKKGQITEVRLAPPVVEKVKFAPPVVKRDAPPARKKSGSTKEVRFPPPIVVPDKPVPPPPPPVEPAKDVANSITILENNEISSPAKGEAQTKVNSTVKSIVAVYKANVSTEKPKKGDAKTIKQEGTVTFEAKPSN